MRFKKLFWIYNKSIMQNVSLSWLIKLTSCASFCKYPVPVKFEVKTPYLVYKL